MLFSVFGIISCLVVPPGILSEPGGYSIILRAIYYELSAMMKISNLNLDYSYYTILLLDWFD